MQKRPVCYFCFTLARKNLISAKKKCQIFFYKRQKFKINRQHYLYDFILILRSFIIHLIRDAHDEKIDDEKLVSNLSGLEIFP